MFGIVGTEFCTDTFSCGYRDKASFFECLWWKNFWFESLRWILGSKSGYITGPKFLAGPQLGGLEGILDEMFEKDYRWDN